MFGFRERQKSGNVLLAKPLIGIKKPDCGNCSDCRYKKSYTGGWMCAFYGVEIYNPSNAGDGCSECDPYGFYSNRN